MHARVLATDRPEELGPQDYVFICLKQHQVVPALDGIASLLSDSTVLIPPTTGIPYWYCHGLGGRFDDMRIEGIDPGGLLWRRLPPERVLGCVFWLPVEVQEPGVVRHDGEMASLPLGEPDGSRSPRLTALADAMSRAGLHAPVVDDIRTSLWMKMISSLVWNPVAALTLATLGEIGQYPGVVDIVRRMMAEADAVAGAFGVRDMPWTFEQRVSLALQQRDHKMSMLQDVERGRPLEVDTILDSIVAMRDLCGEPTPTIDTVYALLKLRAEKLILSGS